MTSDAEFLNAIVVSPNDNAVRREYADWLEARNDSRAHYLRLECDVAEAGHEEDRRGDLEEILCRWMRNLDRAWLASVARRRINECGVRFRFPCPLRWERLQTTDDPMIRSCDVCQKAVYFCATVDEAITHARAGECVALRPLKQAEPSEDEEWFAGDIEDDDDENPEKL